MDVPKHPRDKKSRPRRNGSKRGFKTLSTLASGDLHVVFASLVLGLLGLGMDARSSDFGLDFEPANGS